MHLCSSSYKVGASKDRPRIRHQGPMLRVALPTLRSTRRGRPTASPMQVPPAVKAWPSSPACSSCPAATRGNSCGAPALSCRRGCLLWPAPGVPGPSKVVSQVACGNPWRTASCTTTPCSTSRPPPAATTTGRPRETPSAAPAWEPPPRSSTGTCRRSGSPRPRAGARLPRPHHRRLRGRSAREKVHLPEVAAMVAVMSKVTLLAQPLLGRRVWSD
mmetsp:Transcript_74669/g.242641  ORF Transcript_74669/g.242641 Transcript_74669/m.242641 type:complete len:216 (+) Transcript_74669:1008-1655(+)